MQHVAVTSQDLAELAAEVLFAQGMLRFVARGVSMRPFLFPGDAVIVAPVSTSALRVGMIVLYRDAGGGLVAHRIVQIGTKTRGKPSLVVVRPDAMGFDEEVEVDRILGRIVAVERKGRRRALDRGRLAWAGSLWLRSRLAGLILGAPSRVPRYLAARILPKLQQSRIYRRTAAFLVRYRIRAHVAGPEDIPALAALYRWDDFSIPLVGEAPITRQPGASSRKCGDAPSAGDNESTLEITGWLDRQDASPINAVHNTPPYFFQGASSYLEPENCHVVAGVWGKPAGAVTLRRFPWNEVQYPGWWLFDLIVRVRFRGAGIAERLVQTALREAGYRNAHEVSVLVDYGNTAALALYRKLGFTPVSIPTLEEKLRENASVDGLRRIVLSRPLP